MTTKALDIPALRAALAAAKMSLPLEADDVAVFDADGDLVADTVSHLPGEVENAKLIALAVNALESHLDRLEKLEGFARSMTVVDCSTLIGTDCLSEGYDRDSDRCCMGCFNRSAALAALEKTDGR